MCLHSGQHVSVVCGWLYPHTTLKSIAVWYTLNPLLVFIICREPSSKPGGGALPSRQPREHGVSDEGLSSARGRGRHGESAYKRGRENGVFRLSPVSPCPPLFIALPVSILACLELHQRPLFPL